MTHKLHIENVTKVEIVGDKTTVFVSKGSDVYIDFGLTAEQATFDPVEVPTEDAVDTETVEEPVSTAKPKTTKARAKKAEPVVEEAEEEAEVEEVDDTAEEDIPFDTSDEEGFTELVEEDIQSVNDVFAASSDTANSMAEAKDPKPKQTDKPNLFSQSKTEEQVSGEKKSAFNF